MARNSKVGKKSSGRKSRPVDGKSRLRRGRPKVCGFCAAGAVWVDYKDVKLLARFLSDRGRIRPRGSTGTCAQHQRDVAVAIKTARELALLPYTVRAVSADPGDRRGGARRGPALARPEAEPTETHDGGDEPPGVDAEAVDRTTEDDGVESPEATPASDGQPSEETPRVPVTP